MDKIKYSIPRKSLYILFLLQLFSLQFFTQQFIMRDICINSDHIFLQKTMQSDVQNIIFGSVDPIDCFTVIHNKIKLAQNQVYAGTFRSLQILKHDDRDDNEKYNNFIKFVLEQQIRIKLLLQFLLLLQSGNTLIASDQNVVSVIAPNSEVYLECIPRHVHALPMTFATNLAGNGVAVAISSCAPTTVIAAALACGLGCVGGLLESASSDTRYFSQNCIDVHRNFKTGFVADQVCVPVSVCFTLPIPNAAAVGAPVGYVAGLCSGLAIKKCKNNYDILKSSRTVTPLELAPVAIQQIDR